MFCKDCDKFYNVVSIFPNTEPSIKGIDCLEQDAYVMMNTTTLVLTTTKTDYISSSEKASITASVTGGNGGYKYKIGSSEYQVSNVFTDLIEGSYTITAKDRNNNIVSTVVKISKKPVFVAKPVVLHGITKIFTTTDTFSSYSWSVVGGTIVSGGNSQTVTILFPTMGNATVTVNTVNSNGATGTASYNIEVTDKVLVNAKAILQGAYVYTTNGSYFSMRDDLRIKGFIPLNQPYGKSPYITISPSVFSYVNVRNDGNEKIDISVLGEMGYFGDNITPKSNKDTDVVDWVYLQLRTKNTGVQVYPVYSTRSALILRNGNIVDVDGVSPVKFKVDAHSANDLFDKFYLVVKHRNHLGVMTAFSVEFNEDTNGYYKTSFDFTDTDNSAWFTGSNTAMTSLQGYKALKAGDANLNGQVTATNSGNDIASLLSKVGPTTPNNIVTGYHKEDVTMDGLVEYLGGSQSDLYLINAVVGVFTTSNVVTEQLPPTS